MFLSGNLIRFFICYATAFAAFSLIGKWYLWPAIKDRSLKIALTPLLLYACLRVNGLMFLMPGLVSQNLPSAVPTAYGDLNGGRCSRSDFRLFAYALVEVVSTVRAEVIL
jgi:hypothetical protein